MDLGRKLFFDRRLSFNGTLSCGMCHVPEQGFTQNELATPVGFGGLSVKRNAPALYNVAYRPRLFHDGREASLELQIWSPLLAANEMAQSVDRQRARAHRAMPEYTQRDLPTRSARCPTSTTWGARWPRTSARWSRPIRRSIAGTSGTIESALTDVSNGAASSVSNARGCIACHTIAERSAQFTDELYHDTGIGYAASMRDAPKQLQSEGKIDPRRLKAVGRYGSNLYATPAEIFELKPVAVKP